MGEALEFVKVLVSPIKKLMDIAKSGVGTLYQPHHIRKMADAKAHEIDVIGEALRNNSDVIITYEQGSVIAKSPELEEFIKRTQHRMAYQELLKQYNIESIINNAYGELSDVPEVSDQPVDNDWISSFFNFVENISSEQMQVLWGKLLAGEVKTPGSFSIRTLDVLRKMTQYEANLFQRIVPYILRCPGNKEKTITDYFIISELISDSYEGDILNFPNIQLLSEAGLFSADSLVSIKFNIDPGVNEIISGLNTKIEFKNVGEINAEITRNVFLLTEAGKQLLNIMTITSKDEIGTEYFEKCANILISNDEFSLTGKCTGQIEFRII